MDFSDGDVPFMGRNTIDEQKDQPLDSTEYFTPESGFSLNDTDKTSNCATFWNICNTIQGLPILTIPYVVLVGGWYSLLSIIVVAILTDFSCMLLFDAISKHHRSPNALSPRRIQSYEDLGEAAFGSTARKILTVCMLLQSVSIASIYPLLVGSMLQRVFSDVEMGCWLWVIAGGIFFLPSAFVKNLEQVSWTSIVTVASAKVIFVVLIVYTFQMYNTWKLPKVTDFDLLRFPEGIAILLSCYLAQPFVPAISTSMADPKNFKTILHLAIGLMTLMNVIVGVMSDAAFRPHTKQAVTNNLPEGAFRLVINILGTILSFTSYTLPIYTAFITFEGMNDFFPKLREDDYRRDIFEPHKMVIVTISIAMAAFFPALPLFLALVSSSAGIGLEFVFPPLLYMKICGDDISRGRTALAVGICSFGVIMTLGCISLSSLSVFHSLSFFSKNL